MQSDLASMHYSTYRSTDQQQALDPESHLGASPVPQDGEHVPGYWQRRLMAFIQSMFVLLLILVGLNFFTGLISGHFSLVPFFPLLFLWIILYVGHLGAYKSNPAYLQAYFVFNILIICFVVVSFILFPAVLGSLLCALDGGYNGGCSWDETQAIAHVTFIGFLFAFIPCLPAAMGAIYALRARNELLLAKMRAEVEQELGVTLDRQEERVGLLHAQPISSSAAARPAHYYYQCDYQPMMYMPNPPAFAVNGTTAQQQAQAQAQPPIRFPVPPPAAYYYYPPPPPRTSVPAPSNPPQTPTAPPPSSSLAAAAAVPPSVPQPDEKH